MSIELEEQYDKIYRYCYYRFHNVQIAEDITQETFLRYLEREGGISERPLAYMYTIARNLCIDEYRKRKMEELPDDLANSETENQLVDSLAIQQAVSLLEKEERELIVLRYVNEVSVADMAAIYGISRFSMYRKLKQVLKKLERSF